MAERDYRSEFSPARGCAWARACLVVAMLLGLSVPGLTGIARAQSGHVRVRAEASRPTVVPGDQFAVAVVFEHEPKWHAQANAEALPSDSSAIPTTITFTPPASLRAGRTQWPKPVQIVADLEGTGKPQKYAVFEGRAIAYIPMVVAANAATGPLTLEIAVSYQACNDRTCDLTVDVTLTLELQVVPPGTTVAPATNQSLFAGLDLAAFEELRLGATLPGGSSTPPAAPKLKPVDFQVFKYRFTIDPTGITGLAVMVLLAMLGGFVLNLTPCVLPVLPIKILSLANIAGNRRRMLTLGLASCLGTVAFWLGIGGAIASFTQFKAINQLFQTPFFALGVGVFILVMGVGMLGLFTVGLPQAVYMIDPKRESVSGSFVFGVLVAVLSTPCTAPFMASASAWAATQKSGVTLLVFTAIGVGMALPYALLTFFPALVNRIPRTGPASELVKQVMGLLMLAVAVFFLGTGLDPLLRKPIDPPIRAHWWITAAVVAVAMGWLLWRSYQITRRPVWRATWAVIGVGVTLSMGVIARAVTDRGPIDWVAYTPERLEKSRAEGKVVVLDFTAEWCLNCKYLENTVLHTPDIVALFKRGAVVPMRVDLTGKNSDGSSKLKELGWIGIPLLAIYGPGTVEPEKFDTYTVRVVQDAVERARGARIGRAER